MDRKYVIKQLTNGANLVFANEVEEKVPINPGLYAIFIDHANGLPSPFCDYLLERNTRLIYIGKASKSLRKRLVDQDLRHKGHSTFFRGIGAILGYYPPAGSLQGKSNQNNYKFSKRDAKEIINWINDHLLVRWVVISPEKIDAYEKLAIERIGPLLNKTNNPDYLQELSVLREKCRIIARGSNKSCNKETETTPSSDNELMMQVVWECMEIAMVNKSEAEKLDKAIWDIAAHINSVWIQKGTPLYVVIPALAAILGQLCDEWYGAPMEDDEDDDGSE